MGVPVYYHIEVYSSADTLAFTRTSSTVELTLVDINEVWLKDPSNPQRNLRVMVSKAPDWQPQTPVNKSFATPEWPDLNKAHLPAATCANARTAMVTLGIEWRPFTRGAASRTG